MSDRDLNRSAEFQLVVVCWTTGVWERDFLQQDQQRTVQTSVQLKDQELLTDQKTVRDSIKSSCKYN